MSTLGPLGTKFVGIFHLEYYTYYVYMLREGEAWLFAGAARPTIDVLLVGMNPGPNGMYQTCIPFGDPVLVRDFLKLKSEVDFEVVKTMAVHKRRPIVGLQGNHKREVSGQRVWEWASRTR